MEQIYYVFVSSLVVLVPVFLLYGLYALPRDLYRLIHRRRKRRWAEKLATAEPGQARPEQLGKELW